MGRVLAAGDRCSPRQGLRGLTRVRVFLFGRSGGLGFRVRVLPAYARWARETEGAGSYGAPSTAARTARGATRPRRQARRRRRLRPGPARPAPAASPASAGTTHADAGSPQGGTAGAGGTRSRPRGSGGHASRGGRRGSGGPSRRGPGVPPPVTDRRGSKESRLRAGACRGPQGHGAHAARPGTARLPAGDGRRPPAPYCAASPRPGRAGLDGPGTNPPPWARRGRLCVGAP